MFGVTGRDTRHLGGKKTYIQRELPTFDSFGNNMGKQDKEKLTSNSQSKSGRK